jgi:hypothetical protein
VTIVYSIWLLTVVRIVSSVGSNHQDVVDEGRVGAGTTFNSPSRTVRQDYSEYLSKLLPVCVT